jgi:hypothetical protein
MKREDDVSRTSPLKNFMRTSDAFDLPSEAEKRGEDAGKLASTANGSCRNERDVQQFLGHRLVMFEAVGHCPKG